jgi:hypothetical protein
MKIHYTLDDSAARLPLTIRSADALWDHAAELRSGPGVQLVELTTQYVLNTGAALFDEMAHYFEAGAPSEADPYALAYCYAHRGQLEDLLSDLHDAQSGLVALHEVAEMFPIAFTRDLQLTLALTAVGAPAFGYVRTYSDSEGEEYHGMVVNLAQARAHLESILGQFSLDLLIRVMRHGFFNHEGFLLAYTSYRQATGRTSEKLSDRLKDILMSRGIAWYLSYRHDLAFYDRVLTLDETRLAEYVDRCNAMITNSRKKRATDDTPDEWLPGQQPNDHCLDMVGYFAARSIAEAHGVARLREAIVQGADYFIETYNALGKPPLNLKPRL